MRVSSRRGMIAFAAAATALLLTTGVTTNARAQSKSVQTEGIWIRYDPNAPAVTVKVVKPGRGEHAKRLKKGREATFKVNPEGSVLTRTTVTIKGRKAALGDIPAGKTVYVYWRPDEQDDAVNFARKIDVIFSDEELDEMYPDVE